MAWTLIVEVSRGVAESSPPAVPGTLSVALAVILEPEFFPALEIWDFADREPDFDRER